MDDCKNVLNYTFLSMKYIQSGERKCSALCINKILLNVNFYIVLVIGVQKIFSLG